jgi:hypothetical protein
MSVIDWSDDRATLPRGMGVPPMLATQSRREA